MILDQMKNIQNEEMLEAFLNQFGQVLDAHREKMSRLQLKKLLEKKPIPELVTLEEELIQLILHPDFIELIEMWRPRVEDPILKRRLHLWQRYFTRARIERNPQIRELTRELGDQMITHQYMVGGKKSDLGTIRGILRSSPDPELRKEAWLGKNAVSEELAPRLKELFRLRNKLSKQEGFPTYADLILENLGLSLMQVREILLQLTQDSKQIYQKILQDGQKLLNIDEIHPWDHTYLLESMGGVDPSLFLKDEITPALSKWAKAHGTDLNKLGIEMIRTDIPYNGLCVKINAQEIKMLSNTTDGHSSYRTMFHEMGHALHGAYNQQEYFIFRNDGGIMAEALAELIGYIPRKGQWLLERGIAPEKVKTLQKKLIAPWFHYLRERTALALAEYEMYTNLEGDFDAILSQQESQILGVTLDSTPRWAANSWYISYPIYWQNYVLADVVASQIHHTLDQRYGSLHGHPEAFAEIQAAYYAPGNSVDWQKRLENHTHESLNATALVQDLEKYLD